MRQLGDADRSEQPVREPNAPMPHAIAGLTAEEVVRRLDLKPHPEGGFYRETFRDPRTDADGPIAPTAID